MLAKMVKVRFIGKTEVREVTLEEAQQILENTCNDPVGGMVIDAKTGETIYKIGPDVSEIIVIEQMLGGG
jgi:hypothetical protein